jgi:hypothetical protein
VGLRPRDKGSEAMTQDIQPPEGGSRFERTARRRDTSLARDMLGYVRDNKKWWLVPILGVFLLLGALLLLSSTAAAPFIYTLF